MTRPRSKGPKKKSKIGIASSHRTPSDKKERTSNSPQKRTFKDNARQKNARTRVDSKLLESSQNRVEEILLQSPNENITGKTTYIVEDMTGDSKEFVLDQWQKQAIDALLKGDNIIVDAPTTAGKTRVVEYFIAHHIKDPHFRACYTCPVKSLANDKVREFRELFGHENVGISTGDHKENLNAPLIVATLESYRNSLIGVEPDLNRSLAIFDEYHFIQDSSRGSAWEEALVLSSPNTQILMLSASVGNPEHFQKWLEKIKAPRGAALIQVTERPVPLKDMVFVGSEWLLAEELPKKFLYPSERHLNPLSLDGIAARVIKLKTINLTPCIVYAAQRLVCEDLAATITSIYPDKPAAEQKLISEKLSIIEERFNAAGFLPQHLRQSIIRKGIAYHHSGLAAPARLSVEYLVKEGALDFCVATMGLSLGINFAVRSTVISDFKRPSEAGFVPYDASEILQMTGRAGRRGRDVAGFCCWLNPFYLQKMSGIKRKPVHSQLRCDPTTFLGLRSRGFSLGEIEHFYRDSLAKFFEPEKDLTIISLKRVKKRLQVEKTPCKSPVAEATAYKFKQESLCKTCTFKPQCHDFMKAKRQGELVLLHEHLHHIGCLNKEEGLTRFGELARFFPQNGGLLIAKLIEQGTMNSKNLVETGEIMAALTFPRFKNIRTGGYRFPIDSDELEKEFTRLYPYELFGDVYDPPFGRRRYPAPREFNPDAGAVFRAWALGDDWLKLTLSFTQDSFSQGDMMALIGRVATYLQSIYVAGLGETSQNARLLREFILRPPIGLPI